MTLKYSASSRPGKRFRTWLKDHKTVIVLSAGYSSVLSEIEDVLARIEIDDPSLPFASFREEGLENALTSVAVVLNEGSYCLAPPTSRYEGGKAQLTELLERFEGHGLEAARYGHQYPVDIRLAALKHGFSLA